MTKTAFFVFSVVGYGLLAGCAAPGPHAPAASQPASADPRSPKVFRGATGAPVKWEELLNAAADADAVLIGENHGHPLGLAFAAALWTDLLPRCPRAALALEFFERDDQSRIDDYLAGLSDEETFRKRTGRMAPNYPDGHRRMVEAAKAAGRPVYAANAPRPYVRTARKESYERLARLTAEQRRLFRLPEAEPQGRYREEFNKVMGAMFNDPTHGGSAVAGQPARSEADVARELDATFRSQSLWDWTMADTVAAAGVAGNRPTVLVVGRFHIDQDGGLAQALRRLRPEARVVTISVVNAWADALREEDRDRGGFVVYVGPEGAH